MRIPRMQGRPPVNFGSRVMRASRSLEAMASSLHCVALEVLDVQRVGYRLDG
jgi:hypothetical protein